MGETEIIINHCRAGQAIMPVLSLLKQEFIMLENSREYKAAMELEQALNDYSWNGKTFAESVCLYHRTLQQTLVKTIVAVIRKVGDEYFGYDLRNKSAHELCKSIVDSGLLDKYSLPLF